jgi:osmotically-inducible protein OsmY
VVTVSGKLNSRDEIDRVVQIVKGVPGVVEVKNQMTLPDNYNSVNPTFLDPFN